MKRCEGYRKRIAAWMAGIMLVCALGGLGTVRQKASAASFNDINQSSVFVKQQTGYTCTLASAVMLVRRAALLSGNKNWASITEKAMRGTAWNEGSGLYYNFKYAGVSVGHASLPAGSQNESKLKSLLSSHPEGVVIYDSNKPHAILLTDYTNGVFYCADPAPGTPSGRVKISSASIKLTNANQYWYVKSPKCALTVASQTISDGDYHIVSALDNSLGLSVANNSQDNTANIQLGDSMGDADSSSVVSVKHMGNGYYRMEMKNSGKMLDVTGASTAIKTNVQQFQDNGNNAQRWIIKYAGEGYFYIISKLSSLYLDVSGGASTKGANVQMYTGNDSKAQKWKFVAWGKETGRTLEDGEYQILSGVNTAYGLDVCNGDAADGANIQAYEAAALVNQIFQVKYMADGYYKITCKGSGKMLDVYGAGGDLGTNLQQYTDNGTPAQQWIIKPAGDGFYSIISKCNGLYVDLSGANAQNGRNVWMYVSNGTNAQKWAFIKVQKPKVTFDLQGGTAGKVMSAHKLDGTNIGRESEYLVVYNNSGQKITTNQYGSEAAVDADGKVIELRGYGETKNLTVPKDGFIISGHMSEAGGGHAFTGKLKKGDYVGYDVSTKRAYSYADKNSYLLNHKYVNIGEEYGTLPVISKEGYIFKGWYTAKSGGKRVTSGSKCSSLKLYAQWTSAKVKKTSILKLVSMKKGFKVKWKKTSSINGYQIQYSKSANFTGAKIRTVKKTAVSKSIRNLVKKKKYYVRIRTYKTVNGKKYYSVWSKRKTVKTK